VFVRHFIAGSLERKIRDMYETVCRLEEEKYDWEFKLRKMDFEVRNFYRHNNNIRN